MTSPDSTLDSADPGADVAARFHYQHCYAAIYAIRLITDEANASEIICENHEDFLVKTPAGKFVGTQIKTRLMTRHPFKAGDDQVKKALGKFCNLDRKFPDAFEKFDFTTNHTFWIDEESSNNLPWLLEALRKHGDIKRLRSNTPLRQFIEGIASDTNLAANDVAATLKKTTLHAHASDIAHIHGTVRDALIECPGVKDLPYVTVVRIANAIINLAREASTKTLKGPITELYSPGTDLAKIIESQQLSGKRICQADVLTVIDQFKNTGKSYQDIDVTMLIAPSDVPSDLLRALRKLAKGGVEAARVTNIEDRVRSFEVLFLEWSRKYGAEEASNRYNNILASVQFEAAEARANAEKGGEPYGSTMYAKLAERLMIRATTYPDQVYRCRPEHLMGAAGVLTEKCKAWWSSPFVVSEEAQ